MLSESEQQVLRDVCSIAYSVGVPLMLVGAGARMLVFDYVYGVEGRSTTDWDWGIEVLDWNQFESIRTAMTQGSRPLFRPTPQLHRFIHIISGTFIDIIPFGQISEPNAQIKWPNDPDFTMNVLGYKEALLQSQNICITSDFSIKVINVPTLVVFKLIAWQDRYANKDLEDINFILQHYFNDDVYTLLEVEIINGDVDIEYAGILALGKKIRQNFTAPIVTESKLILDLILSNSNKIFPALISRLSNDWNREYDMMFKRYQTLRHSLD